jgi:uncharacterized protein (DUF1778 family)
MSMQLLEDVRMKKPRKPKDAPLGFRIPAEVKEALEAAADDDSRSVSSLVLKIVVDWLKARKYLK